MLKVYCKNSNCVPYKEHQTDAGIDLKADDLYYLNSTFPVLVHTGIHVEIPKGHVGLIFPRSGLGSKKGVYLANTVGVIDADYRGEIMLSMLSRDNYVIGKGERVAQLVVVPCMLEWMVTTNMSDLSNTERGEGGFGSTGKH